VSSHSQPGSPSKFVAIRSRTGFRPFCYARPDARRQIAFHAGNDCRPGQRVLIPAVAAGRRRNTWPSEPPIRYSGAGELAQAPLPCCPHSLDNRPSLENFTRPIMSCMAIRHEDVAHWGQYRHSARLIEVSGSPPRYPSSPALHPHLASLRLNLNTWFPPRPKPFPNPSLTAEDNLVFISSPPRMFPCAINRKSRVENANIPPDASFRRSRPMDQFQTGRLTAGRRWHRPRVSVLNIDEILQIVCPEERYQP